ncbi:tetratricopeptide repeat protein 36 homolog [Nilaparvata lugens]|uniref:tetratricopeptide repeat protein 36 homolog n=1 Tax=Nilaparvata lugens TaxID=108931 RepID=UPI00193E800E|nr:tetratricopeptide repeat protein 36 homolog [Nilaparvata lugens]
MSSYSAMCSEDRAVLNTIFNPLLPLGEVYTEEFLPIEKGEDTADFDRCQTDLDRQAVSFELKGVQLAESGDLSGAVDAFSRAAQKAPHRPAAYNNRAQVYRIQGNIDAAMLDLNRAIELSGGGRGKSGSQALCQRALLHLKMENREGAVADFTAAARHGNRFAKTQLVKLNPYAALCNQMLSIAMTTLHSPPAKNN